MTVHSHAHRLLRVLRRRSRKRRWTRFFWSKNMITQFQILRYFYSCVRGLIFIRGFTNFYIEPPFYYRTAARQNCNAASLLRFLHRVVDVFKHYFEKLEEESLRDNFVVVYELLDEIMDFGYPQFTEAKILSDFIKTDAYRMEVTQRPPMAVTNAVS